MIGLNRKKDRIDFLEGEGSNFKSYDFHLKERGEGKARKEK